MKKIVLFLVVFLFLTGCSQKPPTATTNSSQQTPTATNGSSGLEQKDLADNIYFRKGESSDGDIVISNPHIKDVRKSLSEYTRLYDLEFSLTDDGKQLFHQCTIELTETRENLSLWIGDEKIISAPINDVINAGEFVLTVNLTEYEIDKIYNKMYNLPAPVETPFGPIDKETLNDILSTVTATFSYNNIENIISSGEAHVVPPPYKNTEESKITSKQDIINLAKNEISGEYSISVAYDSYNKLWSVSFESNDDRTKSYGVILTSEGITKIVCSN